MTDTDQIHIYTPQDDSLESKIRAYRAVYNAWLNAEASLKMLDEDTCLDAIGDTEEIVYAHRISLRSLAMASEDLMKKEVAQAVKQGLLDVNEANELIQDKRNQEIKAIRDGLGKSHSASYHKK